MNSGLYVRCLLSSLYVWRFSKYSRESGPKWMNAKIFEVDGNKRWGQYCDEDKVAQRLIL